MASFSTRSTFRPNICSSSSRIVMTSQRLHGASRSKVTSTSTSLSGEKSSRRTEPKRASSRTCHLRQNASRASKGRRTRELGAWMVMAPESIPATPGAPRGVIPYRARPFQPARCTILSHHPSGGARAVARTFNDLTPPADGQEIGWQAADQRLIVPDRPIIPFIEGDGTGPDIWKATRRVLDGAVEKSYQGSRSIAWFEVLAGEKAYNQTTNWLPQDTIDAIQQYRVAIKGPLTTPVGGGIRSLNVALRQILDLYACVRPVRYYSGVPSPVKEPEKVDMVIFRENIEDVYAGIEWKAGTDEANRVIEFIAGLGKKIRPGSGIGIKPISEFGSKRLVRKAIQFAIAHGRK